MPIHFCFLVDVAVGSEDVLAALCRRSVDVPPVCADETRGDRVRPAEAFAEAVTLAMFKLVW
jgi:hypothetical protein